MTPEWQIIIEKIEQLFKEKCSSIRMDIPSDKILMAAKDVILSAKTLDGKSVPPEEFATTPETVEVDVYIFKEIIDQINYRHKSSIVELANSIGTVVGDYDQGKQSAIDFQSEEDNHIIFASNGLVVKLEKEMVVKILTLGLP